MKKNSIPLEDFEKIITEYLVICMGGRQYAWGKTNGEGLEIYLKKEYGIE